MSIRRNKRKTASPCVRAVRLSKLSVPRGRYPDSAFPGSGPGRNYDMSTFVKIIGWLFLWPVLIPMMIWKSDLHIAVKIMWTLVLIGILVGAFFVIRAVREGPPEPTPVPTAKPELLIKPETPTPDIRETIQMISLDGKKPGKYGKTVTLNAGTEHQTSYIGYFIPSGVWNAASNRDYPDQLELCSEKTKIKNGIEIPDDCRPYHFRPGEEKMINLQEEYYVKVIPPSRYTLMRDLE